MPKGKSLTDLEKGQIIAFQHDCWPITRIAKHLNRSRTVVARFLKNPNRYGSKKRSGRPAKLSDADKRQIIREAITDKKGSKSIVKALQLSASPRTVRRVLHQSPRVVYKKINVAPAMKPHHMVHRVAWAMEKVTWSYKKWTTIVWSDEKKFNLDGPDGLAYHWHDLRKEPQYFSKRQNEGESLMVWGAFAGTRKPSLVVLDGNQNGKKYLQTLKDNLIPFADDIPITWTFMQDGAPCHRANIVKNWLSEEGIRVLDWPAYSPDLNPIENLWGILARKVYENQREFDDLESLEDCIMDAWAQLPVEFMKNLILSMQRRCLKLLQTNGKKLDY